MTFEVTKALCLSTMHIKPETARWLDSVHRSYNAPFSIWEGEHGYFMPAFPGGQENDRDIPVELFRLLTLAFKRNCEFLRLDSDGPIEEGLRTYDWF